MVHDLFCHEQYLRFTSVIDCECNIYYSSMKPFFLFVITTITTITAIVLVVFNFVVVVIIIILITDGVINRKCNIYYSSKKPFFDVVGVVIIITAIIIIVVVFIFVVVVIITIDGVIITISFRFAVIIIIIIIIISILPATATTLIIILQSPNKKLPLPFSLLCWIFCCRWMYLLEFGKILGFCCVTMVTGVRDGYCVLYCSGQNLHFFTSRWRHAINCLSAFNFQTLFYLSGRRAIEISNWLSVLALNLFLEHVLQIWNFFSDYISFQPLVCNSCRGC